MGNVQLANIINYNILFILYTIKLLNNIFTKQQFFLLLTYTCIARRLKDKLKGESPNQ